MTDEERKEARQYMNNLLSIREHTEEERVHGDPDIMGLVEKIIANEIPKCEIICLHSVPEEAGYRCLTHDCVASAREFAEGYCSAVKAVGTTQAEIRGGLARSVLGQLGRAE